MKIEQLQLFYQKGDFNSSEFETTDNHVLFKKIATSVSNAFDILFPSMMSKNRSANAETMATTLVGSLAARSGITGG